MINLTIKLEVKDKLEAYEIISVLSFQHEMKSAKLGDKSTENFTKENPPVMFGKDNKKHAKHFKVFKKDKK